MLLYLTWQLSETIMLKLRSGNEIPLTASFPAEPFLFFSLYVQSSKLIALPPAL